MRRQGTAVLATFVIALLAGAENTHAADRCAGQNELVTSATLAEAERTLLCLLNIHRAASELPVLTHDGRLRAAARAHSEDMVEREYFDHYNLEGESPHDRAVAAGYPATASIGENLVLDPRATPLSLFSALVESDWHNATMLGPDWVTAGMGLALGTPPPLQGTSGATGTQMFGTAATNATDTAVELLVTDECRAARRRRSEAAKEVRNARHQVREAQTAEQEAEAIRRLNAALKRLRKVKRRVERACNPTSF